MPNEHDELFRLIDENLIFAQLRSSRRLQRGLQDGSLLIIERGAFLPSKIFAGMDRFTVHRMVHLARAKSALHTHHGATLGGPTALMAAGIDQLWETSLDIVLYSPSAANYHRKTFPAVTLPSGFTVPQGALHVTRIDSALSVVPVLNAAVQCIRLLPEEQGFVSFLMAAQLLARCDRSDRPGSLSRIETLRTFCQKIHQELQPRARGRERLSRAIEALVGPVESVLEARMAWLLFTAGFEGYATQYPIRYWGGYYYPDFAFPDKRLVLELDGQVKYEGTDFERQIVLEQEAERQSEITQQGWKVARFKWDDFRDKQKVALAIERALL